MGTQTDIRREVTDKIVAALQAGTPPWRKPWRDDLTNVGTPANAASGVSYRGVNALLLGLAGYESRWWATYPQIQALGGRVRKGERATRIVFWRQVETPVGTTDAGEDVIDTFPLLKTYAVFNAAQTDGLERFEARPCTAPPFADFAPAEAVVAATGADIRHSGDRAFYHPDRDFIGLPNPEAFESRAAYYGTLAHEACHWTGHSTRLDRLTTNARFGSTSYAREELVAEIGGCLLAAEVGVPQSDDLSNHAAYLDSWLSILGHDPTAIISAAGQASRAVDYILSFSRRRDAGEERVPAATGAAA